MDDEYDVGPSSVDDDLSLPKGIDLTKRTATVNKLIQEMMPAGISCSKDARDVLIDCCVEFIHLVSSEANEICEKDSRKTISPEHIISALEALGFQEYVAEVQGAYSEHKDSLKGRERKGSKLEHSGLTEEELLKQQEALFQQARLKLQQSTE